MEENNGAFSRKTNWYYKDWEKQERLEPNGRKTVDWVYVGDWYDFEKDSDRLRVKTTLSSCFALLIVVYLLISLSPAYGGRVPYVCYPEFLAAIPVLYFCMGAFWTVYTKGPMTFRRYHASIGRLKWSCVLGTVLMGFTTVAQIVNFIVNSGDISPAWDAVYAFGSAVCTYQFVLAGKTVKQYPAQNIGKKDKTEK